MNSKMIKPILREYGPEWVLNRSLYSMKLRMMHSIPATEKVFEKKVRYPRKIDIFSFNTSEIQTFLQELPDDNKKKLISLADNACKGKLLGFSSIELDYGYPINWNLNPLTGKACDITKKWYQIPDFDPERGDIKGIWEASRFSHFITLVRAYLATDDDKYYRAFSEQLADWVDKNPYSYGANFKCGQECSIRMINGLMAYSVFRDSGLTTNIDKENIEVLILRCYRKVRSNFFYAHKCIKNNHTISELMGMIVGAWCCGEKAHLAYAFRVLNNIIDEQFSGDGGYVQYSFNYERLALQDLEVILSIEDKMEHRLSDKNREKLLNAANLMYQCQSNTGDMPNYGANDGALVFPVTSCGYRDFRPVINAVYAMLSGKRLYEKGLYDEELLWFGKRKNCSIECKKKVSTAFCDAGLFTIRKADSWVMVVLNDYKSRPAHMDQLHFDLWIGGINVFCDSGSYSYASAEGRKLMRNSSHNTVAYDDVAQMNTSGIFMVYDWTERGHIKHTDKLFYGEMRSKNGYRHCRIVEATKNGYRITDRVEGKGSYKVRFHTFCRVEKNGDVYELKANGKKLCWVKSSVEGTVYNTNRSLYYLKIDEITCIEFQAVGSNTVITEIETIGQEK